MLEITGDIWDYHAKGNWIVITTNGTRRKDGACVMGRGVALETKTKFPRLPYILGNEIKHRGNVVVALPEFRVITLPVKRQWMEKADLHLIQVSLGRLVELINCQNINIPTPIFLVRPGCGNGQLDWKNVKPILEKYLDDRFIIVERGTK